MVVLSLLLSQTLFYICINGDIVSIEQGKIVIFTGNGKGKTTAALGLAVKAAAEKRQVFIVQFLKGSGYTGELFAANYLEPYLMIKQFGYGCSIASEIKSGVKVCNKCGQCFGQNRNVINEFAPKALQCCAEILSSNKVDMLVMDEISHAIKHGLIEKQAVVDLILSKPIHMDIILTGRSMPNELQMIADQVTICEAIKHPMTQGIPARRGTEY